MKYRVRIWWYELHGDEIKPDVDTDGRTADLKAEREAEKVVKNLGDHGYEFTETYSSKGEYGADLADEREGGFVVPIWWYELHGDEVIVEADSVEDAEEKGHDIVSTLGDHGYNFTDTYSDKGEYGVDEAVPVEEG